MKIYTKTGDRGTTSLVGGQRVPKNHPRLEAYGTIDELMAQTALLRDNLPDTETMKPYRDDLLRILDHLMRAASYLATEGDAPKYLPPLGDDQVGFLENRIDAIHAAGRPSGRLAQPCLPDSLPPLRATDADARRRILRSSKRYAIPKQTIGLLLHVGA